MAEKTLPYIEMCPVGCPASLAPTDIVLPEGPLRRCADCGQLISGCTAERYRTSMVEFDDPRGTIPAADSTARHACRVGKRLAGITRTLGKPPQGIRLLDVGCSTGAFLTVACKAGFGAEGVEPAPQAARAAQAAGLPVRQGFLETVAFPDSSFDAVTLFEVIEHVREALPLFRECHRILRPGGLLVVGTGNTDSWTAAFMKSRWEYFHIAKHGGHVSFFNPASLRRLAERSGFQVYKVKTSSVSLFEKGNVAPITYRLAKMTAELLNLPSQWLGKGDDLLAFLRRQ